MAVIARATVSPRSALDRRGTQAGRQAVDLERARAEADCVAADADRRGVEPGDRGAATVSRGAPAFVADFSAIPPSSDGLAAQSLTLGAVDDPQEVEADRVAEQVTSLPVAGVSAAVPHLARHSSGTSRAASTEAPPIVREVLGTPGRPLDDATRSYFEPRFGRDFSRVRVHSDGPAANSARAVNAQAYTVRNDIVFGAGRFAPETDAGRRLIAHELVHVAQQQVTLRRQPVKHFEPVKFHDSHALVTAIAKDSPSKEELAGACNYLSLISTADAIALAKVIAQRKASALQPLEAMASAGYATHRVRLILAAVELAGTIGRTGFVLEHELVSDLGAADAEQILDLLGPAVPELDAMQKCSGFRALRPDERLRLTYLIGGSTSVSEKAAAAMRALLAGPHVSKDDPATFRKFVIDEKYLQESIAATRGKARSPGRATIGSATEVPNYKFGGQSALMADALRYDVVVDAKDTSGKDVEQTIPVFLPKTAGVKDKSYKRLSIGEVADISAGMPDPARTKIVHVDVHWMPQNFTPTGTGKPPDGAQTSAAAGRDGVVNIYPLKDDKTKQIDIIHETGHVSSLAAWGDSEDDERWKPWRDAMASDGMAVSQYAKKTIFEDFAESWALYVPSLGTPRKNEIRALIPARCKLMDTLLTQKPRP
jgi:hypothetical protein